MKVFIGLLLWAESTYKKDTMPWIEGQDSREQDFVSFKYFSLTYFYFFFTVYYFWERKRETECEWRRGRERGRHRIWSRLQPLSCQHRSQHGAWTHKPWDNDLSWSWPLNQLSHPGAPESHVLKEVYVPWFNHSLDLWRGQAANRNLKGQRHVQLVGGNTTIAGKAWCS